MASIQNLVGGLGARLELAAQRGALAAQTFLDRPAPKSKTEIRLRIKQLTAAMFLPVLTFVGMVTVKVLHQVIVDLLGAASETVALFLAPLLGMAMFCGLIWVLFKWTSTGGFGYLG